MSIYCYVNHRFLTTDFYGPRLPDVELVIFDVSESTHPITISKNLFKPPVDWWYFELKMTGTLYHWTLRQIEELKTKREYEVVLDSCTFLDSENVTFRLPLTITSLIGEFCNPVISGSYIMCIETRKNRSIYFSY